MARFRHSKLGGKSSRRPAHQIAPSKLIATDPGLFSAQAQPPPGRREPLHDVTDAVGHDAIAGVSLELFARISFGLSAVGYEVRQGARVASRYGIGPVDWQLAVDGWSARIARDERLAQQFSDIYHRINREPPTAPRAT
jgi:hypothetical protein